MRRQFIAIAAIAALVVVAAPASGNQNREQRSDAAAGCTYGTRLLAESDYYPPNAFATYDDYRNSYNAYFNFGKTNECSVAWSWFPPAPGWGISYVLAGTMSSFGGPAGDAAAPKEQIACASVMDPNCAASKYAAVPGGGMMRMVANTYHCEGDWDFNCISKVEVIAPDGTTQQAQFVRHFPDMPKVDGATWSAAGRAMTASPGKSPSLWSYSTAAGSRMLLAQGELEMSWSAVGTAWGNPFQTMHFALLPVDVGKRWQASKPKIKSVQWSEPNGQPAISVLPLYDQPTEPQPADFVNNPNCSSFKSIQQDDHECAYETTFPDGYRYRLTFQMQDFAGFSFMGRLDAPIAYSEAMTGGHRLIVDAAPSASYLVTAYVPKAVMTPAFLAAVQRSMVYRADSWSQNPVDNPPMESRDPDFLAALAPFIGDRSQFKYPAWNFYSLPVNGVSPQCQSQIAGQVVSITSTNATAFDQQGPAFDERSKTFTFKAAAPHYEPDGKTAAVGHYYMNMNAKFMQCVLGTSKVPEVASVALDYETGDANVATVTVHQDKDWLRLAADNFHFSSPQIKVSFAAKSAPATSPPKAPAAAKSVTCVKGKQTKKFVGAKCPSGWKKK